MKTVTNAKELTMEVLEQFAQMFSKTFDPYTYSVQPNGTIVIFNHENVECLKISDTEVTMRDIIQDAYNDIISAELVKIRQKEVDKMFEHFNELFDLLDGLSDLGNSIKVQAEPSITYKSFLYFNTKEMYDLQIQNDSTDVLPFESTEFIDTIKELILRDLSEKWKTKTH